MTIDEMIVNLLKVEGGYSNNPNDGGGPTRYGITQATLSKHLGRPATEDDVKNLDKDLATEIYKADYYFTPRINTLPEALQPQLFDISVNSGPRKSISMLQVVLNMSGFECDNDGMLGPQTRIQCEAAFKAMQGYLINGIEELREHFYKTIVSENKSQFVFLDGWLSRARSFRVVVQ